MFLLAGVLPTGDARGLSSCWTCRRRRFICARCGFTCHINVTGDVALPKFTWNDLVRVASNSPDKWRPGAVASVVGISEESGRRGSYLDEFPCGVVYTIEFADGSSVDVEEASLESMPDTE